MSPFSRSKALFSIYFIAAIDNFGYAMVFVLFPALLLNPEYGFLNSSSTLIEKLIAMGALYAAFPMGQLIGAPMIGELADCYGRKKLFYPSIIGTSLAYLLTGVMIATKSIALIFLARFLTGLFSGNQGLCNASIADFSPNETQRARNYGILTVVWGLSFPLALLLGGIVSDPAISKHFSPSLSFYIAAAITAVALVSLALFFQDTYKGTQGKREIHLLQGFQNILKALQIPEIRPFFILMLIWALGFGYSVTWYSAYVMKHFGVSQKIATFGLIIQGTGWTFGGLCLNPLLLKITSIWRTAKFSYLATGILLGIVAMMPTFYSFITLYALAAMAGSVSLSSTFNLISISASESIQGKAMGIAQSLMSLAFFLIPMLGALSGAISIYTFYPIASFFLFVGLRILCRASQQRK